MTSLRHKHAIARIKHDAHRLTAEERAAIGLPARPVRRRNAPPPFPNNPGAYVWFALTTTTRGEDKAVLDLTRAGFVAFNPTEVVLARSSRLVKFKRKERERAMLTSMVLVGFPGRWVERRRGADVVSCLHADVPWLHVLELERITGFVGMGNGPVPVPLGNVMAIRMQCGRRASTRNWTVSVGDTIEVSVGAWQGRQGQVVELVDGAAKVALFGTSGVLASLAGPLSVPETWVREAAA